MLDVGFSEILLTSAIALIVLGPERLPKVARQVGNWVGRARIMARQLSEQLEREVNAEELLKAQKKTGANTSLDAVHSPSIAPPSAETTTPAAPPPPEPVYGRPASATTPAAMHASDPPVAEHTAATAPQPPHE
jgi:sec-independent protein translocase protein TatB